MWYVPVLAGLIYKVLSSTHHSFLLKSKLKGAGYLQVSRERGAFSNILGPIIQSWGEESFYMNVFIFI